MVRLTDRPDMTLDVYPGRKKTILQKSTVDPILISPDTINTSPFMQSINWHELFNQLLLKDYTNRIMKATGWIYSRLLLSRLRLSRITAYLEEKI